MKKLLKNKKGILGSLVGMALGLTIIISALAFAPTLRDFTEDARNETTITEGITTTYNNDSSVSSYGAGTTTGTEVDDTYTASDVSTQNCGQGTCGTANSWSYGFNDISLANTQVNWTFDVSSSGITGSDIDSINVSGAGCWHGGSARACEGDDPPEFLTDGNLDIYIYDWDDLEWDSVGTTYTIDGTTGDDYQIYSRTKDSDFVNGHISGSGIINIQYNITGTTEGVAYDVLGVYDIINLTIDYSTTSGTTASVTLGMNCSTTDDDFVKAACIATDLNLFYFIGGLIFLGGAILTARTIFF